MNDRPKLRLIDEYIPRIYLLIFEFAFVFTTKNSIKFNKIFRKMFILNYQRNGLNNIRPDKSLFEIFYCYQFQNKFNSLMKN